MKYFAEFGRQYIDIKLGEKNYLGIQSSIRLKIRTCEPVCQLYVMEVLSLSICPNIAVQFLLSLPHPGAPIVDIRHNSFYNWLTYKKKRRAPIGRATGVTFVATVLPLMRVNKNTHAVFLPAGVPWLPAPSYLLPSVFSLSRVIYHQPLLPPCPDTVIQAAHQSSIYVTPARPDPANSRVSCYYRGDRTHLPYDGIHRTP